MSKTTTKTTTVTEEFDNKGALTKRTTETVEEISDYADTPVVPYQPYPFPNVPYVQPVQPIQPIIWSGSVQEVQCTCGTHSVCYKHATLVNQSNSTNPEPVIEDEDTDPFVYDGAERCSDPQCDCNNY